MGCLFDCFRAAGGEPRTGHARAQLVSSSGVPNPKVFSSPVVPRIEPVRFSFSSQGSDAVMRSFGVLFFMPADVVRGVLGGAARGGAPALHRTHATMRAAA